MKESERNRDIDELLDAALALYGSEEPRPGLEARILAGVNAGGRATRPRAWAWGLAAAAALLILVLVLHIREHRPRPSLIPAPAAANHPQPSPTVAGTKPQELHALPRETRSARVTQPWPALFPTPTPITEEEKLLVAYVRETPKSALSSAAKEQTAEEVEIPDLTVAGLKIQELAQPHD